MTAAATSRPLRTPLLLALLTLGLTACGGGDPDPAPTEQVTVSGAVVLPAAALSAASADWNAPHLPGELLVSSGGLSAQAVNTELAGLRTEHLSELGLVRVWTPEPEQLAAKLAEQGIASQPNYLYQALAVPNDPGFPGNAGVELGGVKQHQDYLTQIGAAEGWGLLESQGKPPAGVLTAVLDTGVDRSHPDLAGRIAGGFDFCSSVVGGGCSGTDSDYSDILNLPHGHGTAMTGLIGAATNNGTGLSGVTWSGPLLAVKVLGDVQGTSSASASTASLAQGLGYAIDQKARVINMSLGIPGLQNDPAVRAQLERAAAADIVMVAAAGNTPRDGLYFPANQPEVFAVGAVNPQGQISCFSARPLPGETEPLDLLAPGGESGCSRQSSALLELTRDQGYQLGGGTSEASALVSGAASLLRAAYPGLNAAQVKQALVQGGQPTDITTPQLNLPGALSAAQALTNSPAPTPVPTPTPTGPALYSMTVQAYQNGQPVGSAFQKTNEPLSALRLPYSLNLPRGSYELRATVSTQKATYHGVQPVAAQTDTTVDIQVQ